MVTLSVECEARDGKKEEVAGKLTREVLPTLRKQPGFVDLVVLSDEGAADLFTVLSFWRSSDEARRYEHAQYEQFVNLLRPLLVSDPRIVRHKVEASTQHNIAIGRAA